MELEKNNRGFYNGNFTDLYGEICSIQKSSLATDDAIWLGINKPKLTVFKNEQKGQYLECEIPKNFSVSSRMHLNREQVAELLPLLQRFVETGDLGLY